MEDFGPGLGWYVKVSSFSNQAMWMASREQVSTTTSLSLSDRAMALLAGGRRTRHHEFVAGAGWGVVAGEVLQQFVQRAVLPAMGPGLGRVLEVGRQGGRAAGPIQAAGDDAVVMAVVVVMLVVCGVVACCCCCSGGLQIYEQCRLKKVLPLDEFDLFLSHHMVGHPSPSSSSLLNGHANVAATAATAASRVGTSRLAGIGAPPQGGGLLAHPPPGCVLRRTTSCTTGARA